MSDTKNKLAENGIKGRGGRPKVYENKRETKMEFWANKREEVIIRDKAKKAGLKPAVFMRESALHFDERQLPKIRLEAIYEIRKIGVNFNQIAHVLNSKNISGNKIEIETVKEDIKSVIEVLKEQLLALKI